MKRIVRKTAAECKISPKQKRDLAKLSARPDSEIDLSDIPELTGKLWKNALQNPFYRPIKKQITLRLDADVIAWLRKHGEGYQTKANSLLREIMVKDIGRKAS
ncbi:MAG TPA: BrnA antitoxin family protein [Candidatus Saccharimonadales bacterium]|nr:BrnA antitoxin family protein [Candidatus Saccharimonadales bacterium]